MTRWYEIESITRSAPRACEVRFVVPADSLFFDGHFVDGPIIPGIALLGIAEASHARVTTRFPPPRRVTGCKRVRFRKLLCGGGTFVLSLTFADEPTAGCAFAVRAALGDGETICDGVFTTVSDEQQR